MQYCYHFTRIYICMSILPYVGTCICKHSGPRLICLSAWYREGYDFFLKNQSPAFRYPPFVKILIPKF